MKEIYFKLALFYLIFAVAYAAVPVKNPPQELIPEYTLNGSIPIEYYFVDDTLKGESTHFTYTSKDIDRVITTSKQIINKFDNLLRKVNLLHKKDDPDSFMAISNLIWSLPKFQWVHFTFYIHEKDIANKRICVFGSSDPWVEAMLLALGASEVITIEYNQLTFEHPALHTIPKESFNNFYNPTESPYRHYFDALVSISSFDHDGLGRYGDPLSPQADINMMEKIVHLLRMEEEAEGGGRMFLTVPIGQDTVVFNLHRQYGTKRLPLLLQHWDIVHILGWEERQLQEHTSWRKTYEPVFVLKPKAIVVPPIPVASTGTTITCDRDDNNECSNVEVIDEAHSSASLSSSVIEEL